MNRFLLARHGKTINNQECRLSGQIDTPLTADGLEPTKRVIEKLASTHVDYIYSSDLGRAFTTAYVIARGLNYAGEIVRHPGLREVNYGDAANMLSAEAYQKYPLLDRDTHYIPPNGQSLDQMQQAALAAVADINDAYDDKTILIVAHSGVMAALNASFRNEDFGGHNISEAYGHDFVAEFSFVDERVSSFTAFGS